MSLSIIERDQKRRKALTVEEEEEDEFITEAILKWKKQEKPTNDHQWIQRAIEASKVLSKNAAKRDREGKVPSQEINLLKAAGFVNLLGPVEFGGGGQTWELSYRIVVEVSKADGSIGHLLGNHYSWFWSSIYFSTIEQRQKWLRILTEGNFYIGGAVNPRNNDMLAIPSENGKKLIFRGKKHFCTGSTMSDIMILEGVLPDGEHVFAYVPSDHPGLVYLGDWDAVGQRLTESGGVVINDVEIDWEDALGFVDKVKIIDDAYTSLILPAVQLQFAAVHTGVGLGALETAAEYTRTITRAWPYGGDNKETATDEWYIRENYGNLAAKLYASEALVHQTGEQISKYLHAPRSKITEAKRGELAVSVAASKVVAAEAALEASSKIFELTGSRSTLRKYALDRFWRNTRVHSLHDPLSYKKREVGSYFLLKEIPTPSWYS